jgi:hypothetical protein
MTVSIPVRGTRQVASFLRNRRERHVEKLMSPKGRNRLADSLERLLHNAETPHCGFSSQVPLQRHEILANRAVILELADELRSTQQPGRRGVELIEWLLTNGWSPLYSATAETSLETALKQARAALLLSG